MNHHLKKRGVGGSNCIFYKKQRPLLQGPSPGHTTFIFFFFFIYREWVAGADPGFKVRGGTLKKLRRAEGDAKFFWDISCAPLLDPPLSWTSSIPCEQRRIINLWLKFLNIDWKYLEILHYFLGPSWPWSYGSTLPV